MQYAWAWLIFSPNVACREHRTKHTLLRRDPSDTFFASLLDQTLSGKLRRQSGRRSLEVDTVISLFPSLNIQ